MTTRPRITLKTTNSQTLDIDTGTVKERFALVRAELPDQWVQPKSTFWNSTSAAAEAVGGRLSVVFWEHHPECGGQVRSSRLSVAALLVHEIHIANLYNFKADQAIV
ncbi:hypothetical protein C8R44DRAFT_896341 [Mycena epipterygia]|nr:hypothetical protein C8R44DRAFT_896341 [Mycena epipterygia]